MKIPRQWTELSFGKYYGKTLPQLILHDPDWFFWAMEKDIFDGKLRLAAEATELALKARSIRLPVEGWFVEYLTDRQSGVLLSVSPVPEGTPIHEGSSVAHRSRTIDLSFARRCRKYDKFGSRRLVETVRLIYFRDSKKLTKVRCEAFFENEEHFDLEAANQPKSYEHSFM